MLFSSELLKEKDLHIKSLKEEIAFLRAQVMPIKSVSGSLVNKEANDILNGDVVIEDDSAEDKRKRELELLREQLERDQMLSGSEIGE